MKKLKTPRLVTVAILTTITIIFWIFYGLYDILTATPPLKVPEEILAPISPTLDRDALNSLQDRIFFEESEAETFSPIIQTTITPTPGQTTPTPTPTEAVEQEETPTITPSE